MVKYVNGNIDVKLKWQGEIVLYLANILVYHVFTSLQIYLFV